MKKNALTTYEIAKYCDVAPRTVNQWIKEGKMEAFRTPGKHSRVRIENFLRFLEEYNIPIPQEFKTKNSDAVPKILIVDDDKNMAKSIRRLLALKKNYDLEVAFDGFDAGRKIAVFNPDLVILDIKMPGMDGFEVARRIKQTAETSHTQIIAISAFFNQKEKKEMLSIGAKVCFDKPLDQEKLLEEIDTLLR